jgi:hypothetical protein
MVTNPASCPDNARLHCRQYVGFVFGKYQLDQLLLVIFFFGQYQVVTTADSLSSCLDNTKL